MYVPIYEFYLQISEAVQRATGEEHGGGFAATSCEGVNGIGSACRCGESAVFSLGSDRSSCSSSNSEERDGDRDGVCF